MLIGASSPGFGSVVLLSNIDRAFTPGNGGSFPNADRKNGGSFAVGETGFTIDSVKVALKRLDPSTDVTFTMELFSVAAGQQVPAENASPLKVETFTFSLTATPTVFEFNPTDVWILEAGERYGLGLTAEDGHTAFMQWSQTQDPLRPVAGFQGVVPLGSFFSITGGASWGTGNFVNGFELTGTEVVPEPSTYAVICGLAVLGAAVYRRRQRKLVNQ